MAAFPDRVFHTVHPPSQDVAWIAYVVAVGQTLKAQRPELAAAYWKGRCTTIRKRLAGAGLDDFAVEAEVFAFEAAVRAEAQRQSANRDGAPSAERVQ